MLNLPVLAMGDKPKIKVEIDKHSGFCFGVVNAISNAEEELKKGEPLFCLGEIVHNSEEVERLKKKGLTTISHQDLNALKNQKVMLRAHGEPPETYKKALENSIQLVDASCPVVLKLQVKVHEGWRKIRKVGGAVVIFGKKGHAEVIGLVGQTNGEAIVIESIEELDTLDFTKPIELFAQTTISAEQYAAIAKEIRKRIEDASNGKSHHFMVHNSICGKVANRKMELTSFAGKYKVIVFVSGKNSSNGKMLYKICKTVNPQSFFISSAGELNPDWFKDVYTVGVCGATSTPLWLMEEVAKAINDMEL